MDSFTLALIAAIIGALAGIVRTWQSHGLKLIAPMVTIKGYSIKIRLGWMASALLGAFFAWSTIVGLWTYLPTDQIPDTIYEVTLVSASIGYSSLYILNARLGKELPDIDAYEFGLNVSEININKAALMLQILNTFKCVERIQIIDNKYAGVGEIYIVVKPDCDREATKQEIEKYIAQYRPAFVQITVKLPDEVLIDISLKAIVLDISELDPEYYRTEIIKRITEYINSLQPGHWVKKSKIISNSIIDKYVKDVPGNQIIASPEFADGIEIRLDPFQVARAGTINVEIQTVSPLSGH